jgi:hypothetical protein
VTIPPRASAGALAIAFLALHLPFLAPSLEDLDSINFALGLQDFDVAEHRPHPPGYPLFILAAKGVVAVVDSEARALSLIGVVTGALSAFPLVATMGTLGSSRAAAVGGVLLAMTSPLFWVTAARPLSDMAGLAAALSIQALALTARTPRMLAAAALCAGLAAGVRSQVVWLTVPIVLLAWLRWPTSDRRLIAPRVLTAYFLGVAAWLVPLVLVSGGPMAYWQALSSQGAEDFSGVAMLWTTPSPRLLIDALRDTFLSPWVLWIPASLTLALAAAGLVRLVSAHRAALVTVVAAFAPYLVFHLLFQETVTTRYALPLVVPVAALAALGLEPLGGRAVLLAIVALVATNLAVAHPTLAAYSGLPAPAFRMLADMRQASGGLAGSEQPVLATHFDSRRAVQWAGPGVTGSAERLDTRPRHEWLEVVRYWNGGGRRPVWFAANPRRTDLALIEHDAPRARYRWPFPHLELIGGVRPSATDWYTLRQPAWYLGEGWSLTPETAGVAGEDGKGPGKGAIEGWIRRFPGPGTLMIGGRNLIDGGPPIHVRVLLDGQVMDEATVPPGFFLRLTTLEAGRLLGSGDYARLTVSADRDGLAVEQFDAQPAGRPVFGFAEGWHELEHNTTTGRVWRWTSERALLRVRPEGHDLTLVLDGETDPGTEAPRVVIKAEGRTIADQRVGRTFSIRVAVPAGVLPGPEATISVETDQTHVPAEQSWRTRDRRRLGLRVYECRIAPAS